MRNLDSRIKKLEQREGSNIEEIYALLDEEKLNIFERTKVLVDAGLITGEMIAGWIKEEVENLRRKTMNNDFITKNVKDAVLKWQFLESILEMIIFLG